MRVGAGQSPSTPVWADQAPDRPPSAPQPRVWSRPAGVLALVVLAVLMAFFMANVTVILARDGVVTSPSKLRQGGDSYIHWFALNAVRDGHDPYTDEVARATQIAIWGMPDKPHVSAFIYPLSSELWYLPVLGLDLEAAALYARLLGLAMLAVMVVLGVRLAGLPSTGWTLLAAVALLGSLAAPYDQFALGQNPSIIVAPALGAALLYRARHYSLAGVVLSLALLKPQYVVILLLGLGMHALWARERWPFLAGFALGSGLPLVISLLVQPAWPARWLNNLVTHSGGYAAYLSVIVGDSPAILWPLRALIVLPILAQWWRLRRRPVDDTGLAMLVALSLVAGMVAFTANPGLYNVVLAWPLLVWIVLSPAGAPVGLTSRVVHVFNLAFVLVIPLMAGTLTLVHVMTPKAQTGPALTLLATLLVWASLCQAVAVLGWGLERLLPHRVRAWRGNQL